MVLVHVVANCYASIEAYVLLPCGTSASIVHCPTFTVSQYRYAILLKCPRPYFYVRGCNIHVLNTMTSWMLNLPGVHCVTVERKAYLRTICEYVRGKLSEI